MVIVSRRMNMMPSGSTISTTIRTMRCSAPRSGIRATMPTSTPATRPARIFVCSFTA